MRTRVSVCGSVHVSIVDHGGQKRALDSLGLDLHVVVNHPIDSVI